MENTENDSMSAIRLWSALEGGLPHHLLIFRKTEPLGKELNNAACSRLGTRLCRNLMSIDLRLNRIDPRMNMIFRQIQNGDTEANSR